MKKSCGCGQEPCALSWAVKKEGKCSPSRPARQAYSLMAHSPAGMPQFRHLTTHFLHPCQPTAKPCPFSGPCRSQILFSSRQTRRKSVAREREGEQIRSTVLVSLTSWGLQGWHATWSDPLRSGGTLPWSPCLKYCCSGFSSCRRIKLFS